MKPTLGYLILARDTITDSVTQEASAIRIFDTLFILRGQETLTYTLAVLGRIYLNTLGIFPNVYVRVKISHETEGELHTEPLLGTNINAEFGMNINAKFWFLQFKNEGKYKIDVSVSTDNVIFTDLDNSSFFYVKKQV